MSRYVTILLCGVFWALGGQARSQSAPLPLPPAPPSSTAILAHHVVSGLYGPDQAFPVAATFHVSVVFLRPPKATDPDAFRVFVAESLAVALGKKGLSDALADNPREADHHLHVVLKFHKGHLVATARLRRLPVTIWERLRIPKGHELGTSMANVPLDLEIRSILGLVSARINTSRLRLKPVVVGKDAQILASPILSINVTDLDGDRLPEVTFLQRNSVHVARWSGRGFQQILARHAFDARPNSAKVRHPIGALVTVIEPSGKPLLVTATSDYSAPIALRLQETELVLGRLKTVETGWPLYGQGVERLVAATWPKGTDVFRGLTLELGLFDNTGQTMDGLGDGYVVSAFPHYQLHGLGLTSAHTTAGELSKRVTWSPYLVHVGSDYQVTAHSLAGAEDLGKHGTAVCLADINSDGQPEVLTTSTSLGGGDTLRLYSRQEDGTFSRIWSATTKSPVTALAYGDIDRDGQGEFLVATAQDGRASLFIIPVKLAR